MNKLSAIVADLSPETKTLLFGGPRAKLFSAAITQVLNEMAAGAAVTPPPELMLAAFRHCPTPRVVILGQDPYPTEGVANGLSFGAAAGTPIPPSLRNIYKCLVKCGLLADVPKTPDLTPLCGQGVMLLNCALTTVVGKPGAHKKIWADYSNAIIEELSKTAPIFILLGGDAKAKACLLDESCTVYEWGHPSPMNDANKRDGPLNFVNCTAFKLANEKLISMGYPLVDYNVIVSSAAAAATTDTIDPNTLYVFTDGGATKNGFKGAKATWGFYAAAGATLPSCSPTHKHTDSGIVPEVDIPGKEYRASNNRGELLAIRRALDYIKEYPGAGPVCIISDSKYGIDCVSVWVNAWLADESKMQGKLNLDIILPAAALLKEIRKNRTVTFRHVRGHRDEPAAGTYEWFTWKGNDVADKLCSNVVS